MDLFTRNWEITNHILDELNKNKLSIHSLELFNYKNKSDDAVSEFVEKYSNLTSIDKYQTMH